MNYLRPVIIGLLALAALALLLHGGDDTPATVSAGSPAPLGDFAPGELLVKVRPGLPESTGVAAAAVEGARAVGRIPQLDVVRIDLPPEMEVAEAVELYERLPWVEFAEPNYYLRADVVPNDTFYGSNQSWYYDLIQAPAAWDITTGSSSIVVAVVDTGADLNHPDLINKLEPGAAFISLPLPGCSSPASNNPQDDDGHGTMVAGMVGAETNNGVGMAGTAWGVRLVPVKVLDCTGVGLTSDIADGIGWAASQGADIVNMSLGQPVRNPDTGLCEAPAPNGTLQTAIQQAQATYGTIFVGAAGNEDCPYVANPAAFPEVIAVGASGGQSSPDVRAACPSLCLSNWGPEIDVAAPGESICSTVWDNAYACGSGTSFAAPLVSGLAALILSQNPGFGLAEVRSVLCVSAVGLADGSTAGWDGCGRIDMEAALSAAPAPAPGCDYNNDGFDDLAVGVPGEDVGAVKDAGAVNVLYGSGSGLTGSGDQLWHQGLAAVGGKAEAGDSFGDSLTCGDFNADGFDDLAIGAPGEDVGSLVDAGAVNVLYGSGSGLTGSGDQLWHQSVPGVLGGAEAGDVFGGSLASGDFNGDGKDDLAVGVPGEDVGATVDAGAVSVLYGSGSGLTGSGDQLWHQGLGAVGGNAEAGDLFGDSLASGDFDGDGKDDLALGVPGESIGATADAGAVNVLYGSGSGLTGSGDQLWHQGLAAVIGKAEAGDLFGSSLASGDYDGDSKDDLAIGAPGEDVGAIADAGAVNVLYGLGSGLTAAGDQMWHQDSPGVLGSAEAGDSFGGAMTSGDYDNDGFDDLAIGVPGEDVGTVADAGAVNVLYGSATGLAAAGPPADQLWYQGLGAVEGTAEAGDLLGVSVVSGDYDSDGSGDLALGVEGEDIGATADAGAVNVLYGSGSGLTAGGDQLWHQDTSGVLGVAEAFDSFGDALGQRSSR